MSDVYPLFNECIDFDLLYWFSTIAIRQGIITSSIFMQHMHLHGSVVYPRYNYFGPFKVPNLLVCNKRTRLVVIPARLFSCIYNDLMGPRNTSSNEFVRISTPSVICMQNF